MSLGIDKQPAQPNYKKIDKFFRNIDFVVPGYHKSSQYMAAIHQAFYHWMVPQVSGKNVLDAGSGEGYGVDILGQSANWVVGIDIKIELVSYAKNRYPASHLNYLLMDCENIAFQNEAFDIVVCNEMVEHLKYYREFLNSAFAILKPGGMFICATTNAGLSFSKNDGSPMNRNHYQEFTAEQLTDELQSFTDDIEIYSEIMNSKSSSFILNKPARGIEWLLVKFGIKHKIPIRFRNFIREKITGVKVDDMISEGYEIIEGDHPKSLYVIARCTKK